MLEVFKFKFPNIFYYNGLNGVNIISHLGVILFQRVLRKTDNSLVDYLSVTTLYVNQHPGQLIILGLNIVIKWECT